MYLYLSFSGCSLNEDMRKLKIAIFSSGIGGGTKRTRKANKAFSVFYLSICSFINNFDDIIRCGFCLWEASVFCGTSTYNLVGAATCICLSLFGCLCGCVRNDFCLRCCIFCLGPASVLSMQKMFY